MSKSRYDLWDDIQSLMYSIQRLGGIVQNEGEISADEMVEWIFNLKEATDKLNLIQSDMLKYYIVSPQGVNPKYSLDDLLNEITDENKHDEIDFGKPQGKEFL